MSAAVPCAEPSTQLGPDKFTKTDTVTIADAQPRELFASLHPRPMDMYCFREARGRENTPGRRRVAIGKKNSTRVSEDDVVKPTADACGGASVAGKDA